MKKYGFFGGSFNPVTKAHIELAKLAINKYHLDKIIFVPMGNKYIKKDLIDEKHRYNMLKLVTDKYNNLEVSDIEMNLEKSLTAIEALKKINKQYENIDIYYIIGADNLEKMPKWEKAKELIENYKYIVIQRETYHIPTIVNQNKLLNKYRHNFYELENEKYKLISSSIVRQKIYYNQIQNIEKYIEKEIVNYIVDNNIYNDK